MFSNKKKKPLENPPDYDLNAVASATDATGLFPFMPISEEEIENYENIREIEKDIVKDNENST